ncbi:UNVERIFIED_CONTAM: hypothetical protein K2H54_027690 [Gekko kuhli]
MYVLAGIDIVYPHCYDGDRHLASQVVQTGPPTPGLAPIQKALFPIRYFSQFLLNITFKTWLTDTMHGQSPTPTVGQIIEGLNPLCPHATVPISIGPLQHCRSQLPQGTYLFECKSP